MKSAKRVVTKLLSKTYFFILLTYKIKKKFDSQKEPIKVLNLEIKKNMKLIILSIRKQNALITSDSKSIEQNFERNIQIIQEKNNYALAA